MPRFTVQQPAAADRCSTSPATRLALMFIGAVPVSLIAVWTFGLWSIRTLATWVLLPSLVLLTVMAARSPAVRKLIFRALAVGAVSTFMYDLFRWSCLLLGLMNRDPIPHIGAGLGLEPDWAFGYLWRFVGNGGGIALAFYALGGRGAAAGTAHGLFVCCGLLAVLRFAPNGQDMLFPLNPTTVIIATAGHIIYGSTLGALAARLRPPLTPAVHMNRAM